MKGYLQKTEGCWFVIYDQRTMQDPSAEDGILPLHPKNASFLDMNLTSTTFFNKEIEFEEINLVDKLDYYQNCVFKTYAQFITTDDHIVNTNEMVSDKILFEQATVAMEEQYGYGCETEIDAYFRGAIWMRDKIGGNK